MDRTEASRHILRLTDRLGFGLAGITDARPSPHADYIRDWIAAGRHGEMGYLANHLDVRLDPGRFLPGARAVIVTADAYPAADPSATPRRDRQRGRVARYAWGDDYHKVMKRRLHTLCDELADRFPEAAFRAAVDTAPVHEREHAVRAGLGWIGKHTLLIHPRHGSWLLLGVVVTTLDLATSQQLGYPRRTVPPEDHCGTCTRCIDACPTDAIAPAGYQLDATRCISYLTLEHRGPIDPALHAGMGEWIAGCDVCQEVCPHNREPSARPGLDALPIHPRYQPRGTSFDLLEMLGWSAEDRQAVFRGSALKRIKLDMLKRNALIAAANALEQTEDDALRQRIEAIAGDAKEPALVQETARQVLARV